MAGEQQWEPSGSLLPRTPATYLEILFPLCTLQPRLVVCSRLWRRRHLEPFAVANGIRCPCLPLPSHWSLTSLPLTSPGSLYPLAMSTTLDLLVQQSPTLTSGLKRIGPTHNPLCPPYRRPVLPFWPRPALLGPHAPESHLGLSSCLLI